LAHGNLLGATTGIERRLYKEKRQKRSMPTTPIHGIGLAGGDMIPPTHQHVSTSCIHHIAPPAPHFNPSQPLAKPPQRS
jgi:hypothetical protein